MASNIEIRATSSAENSSEIKARFDAVKAELEAQKDFKGSGRKGAVTDFDTIAFLVDEYEKRQRGGIVRKDSPLDGLREIVREILQNNDKAEHDYQKRRITNAMLNNASKAKTDKAANNEALNTVLTEFAEEIEANHKRNGIGENHNRTAPRKHQREDIAGYPGY